MEGSHQSKETSRESCIPDTGIPGFVSQTGSSGTFISGSGILVSVTSGLAAGRPEQGAPRSLLAASCG